MQDTFNAKLLEEALRIGERVLAEATQDESGIFWTAPNPTSSGVEAIPSADLYRGGAGVALFLMELSRRTNETKYLEAAISAINWCLSQNLASPTFYTGRLGISFAALRLADMTGDKIWRKRALSLAEGCTDFLERHEKYDLLSGIAGTILGLLHLHQATGADWIIDALNRFTERLITSSRLGASGVYWDRGRSCTKGFTGFAHGAGGVGFVLLELGRYLKNPAYYWLAQQAFNYENRDYDEERGDWLDYRKTMVAARDMERLAHAIKAKDKEPFEQPRTFSFWCYGAPGIGLSRLRAQHLTPSADHSRDLNRALARTQAVTVEPNHGPDDFYILCHGHCGNAMLQLECYRLLDDSRQLEQARKVAQKTLAASKQRDGEYLTGVSYYFRDRIDPSLFMGIAGIGYFLLQAGDPKGTPSIMAPWLMEPMKQSVGTEADTLQEADLKRRVIGNGFPLTLEVTEGSAPLPKRFWYDASNTETLIENLEQHVNGLTPANPIAARLKDVLLLEQTAHKWDLAANPFYIDFKRQLAARNPKEEADSSQPLVLSREVLLHRHQWNWEPDQLENTGGNLSIEASEITTLFKQEVMGVKRFSRIPEITVCLFEAFEKPKTPTRAIDEVIERYDLAGDVDQVVAALQSQIQEALAAGILEPAHTTKFE